jgi:hypothetical protein
MADYTNDDDVRAALRISNQQNDEEANLSSRMPASWFKPIDLNAHPTAPVVPPDAATGSFENLPANAAAAGKQIFNTANDPNTYKAMAVRLAKNLYDDPIGTTTYPLREAGKFAYNMGKAAYDKPGETFGNFAFPITSSIGQVGDINAQLNKAKQEGDTTTYNKLVPLLAMAAVGAAPGIGGEAKTAEKVALETGVKDAADLAKKELIAPVAEDAAKKAGKKIETPEVAPASPASITETGHSMDVERNQRKTVDPSSIKLTPEEKEIVNKFTNPSQKAMVASSIRATKARYPTSDGWAAMELSDASINEKGLPELTWQQPAYGFNRSLQDVNRPVLDSSGQPITRPVKDPKGNIKLNDYGDPIEKDVTWPVKEERSMKKGTPEYDEAVNKAASNSYKEIEDVIDRANKGDTAAQVILRQVGWYREFMRKGFDERGGAYPAFSDLLGATSPNTAVDQNYSYAVEAQRRHARGDFDPQVGFAKDFQEKLNTFPPEQLIYRDKTNEIDPATGNFKVLDPDTDEIKQFGMNSRNAQMAMADKWRTQEEGSAPKARNFSGNLGGATDQATIDVWAARHIQRMLGRERLPPPIEGGVKGKMMMSPGNIPAGQYGPMPLSLNAGGEFGFGQDMYSNLADKVNQSNILKPYLEQLGYDNITPMDLQALTWFLEKEHWTKNNWTTKSGEGGSFEQEMERYPGQRWQSGFSIQQDVPPTDAAMAKTRETIEDSLNKDPNVSVFRVHPTQGRYAGSNERSFDTEITANPNWNPSQWMAATIKEAKDNNQKDVFFSRRLSPEEANQNPNARPGTEIYFQNRKDMQEILPILDEFTKRGTDGFTFTTDLRHRERVSGGADTPDYVGVRLQYVPEIRMRYDDDFRKAVLKDPSVLENDMKDAQDRMQDALMALDKSGAKIVDARIHHYDTLAIGQESYDKFLNGITEPENASRSYESNSRAVNPTSRFGQSISSHVKGRDTALREAENAEGSKSGGSVAQPNSQVTKFKSGGKVKTLNLHGGKDSDNVGVDRALEISRKLYDSED